MSDENTATGAGVEGQSRMEEIRERNRVAARARAKMAKERAQRIAEAREIRRFFENARAEEHNRLEAWLTEQSRAHTAAARARAAAAGDDQSDTPPPPLTQDEMDQAREELETNSPEAEARREAQRHGALVHEELDEAIRRYKEAGHCQAADDQAEADFERITAFMVEHGVKATETVMRKFDKLGFKRKPLHRRLRQVRMEQSSARMGPFMSNVVHLHGGGRGGGAAGPQRREGPELPVVFNPRAGDDYLAAAQQVENLLAARVTQGARNVSFRNMAGLLVDVNADPEGNLRISVLPEVRVLHYLSNTVAFQVMRNGEDGPEPVPADPHKRILEALMDGTSLTDVPVLKGIATLPYYGPNGLVCGTGYDVGSQTFMSMDEELRACVPDADTSKEDLKEAAVKALCYLLYDWLCDVPTNFEGRLVLVAAALTMVQRPGLVAKPAVLLDGPSSAAGKTHAAQMIIALATGKAKFNEKTWKFNMDDRGKEFLGWARSGLDHVFFPNVKTGTEMNCPLLASATTEGTINWRALYTHDSETLPAGFVQLFAGKAIRLGDELTSRVFKVEIIKRVAKRKRDDGVTHTLKERLAILKHVYAILAFGQAGGAKDGQGLSKTRFTDWDRQIGQPLEYLAAEMNQRIQRGGDLKAVPDGQPMHPQRNVTFAKILDRNIEDDVRQKAADALVAAIIKATGGIGKDFTARDLLKAAQGTCSGPFFQVAPAPVDIGDREQPALQEITEDLLEAMTALNVKDKRGVPLDSYAVGLHILPRLANLPVTVDDQLYVLRRGRADRRKTRLWRVVKYEEVLEEQRTGGKTEEEDGQNGQNQR